MATPAAPPPAGVSPSPRAAATSPRGGASGAEGTPQQRRKRRTRKKTCEECERLQLCVVELERALAAAERERDEWRARCLGAATQPPASTPLPGAVPSPPPQAHPGCPTDVAAVAPPRAGFTGTAVPPPRPRPDPSATRTPAPASPLPATATAPTAAAAPPYEPSLQSVVDLERALAWQAREARCVAGAVEGKPYAVHLRSFEHPHVRLEQDAMSTEVVAKTGGAAAEWFLIADADASSNKTSPRTRPRPTNSSQRQAAPTFAVCTQLGAGGWGCLCVEDGRLVVSAERRDARWALVPCEGGASRPAFIMRELGGGAYVLQHKGRVTTTRHPHDAMRVAVAPVREGNAARAYAYRHALTGLDMRNQRALDATMPEMYSTASLLRGADGGSRGDGGGGVESAATRTGAPAAATLDVGDVKAVRGVAVGVLVVALFLSIADPALDVAVMFEYYHAGEDVLAAAALALLVLGGVARLCVAHTLLSAGTRANGTVMTPVDYVYLAAAALPVPLVDVLELCATLAGVLRMGDRAFGALSLVRLRRTQLRGATTAASVTAPQLCLQGYVYGWRTTTDGGPPGDETVLLSSIFAGAAALVWAAVVYAYDAAGQQRGPRVDTFDLTDRRLKRALAHASHVQLLQGMTPSEFVDFHDRLGGLEYGTLHLDDVQVIIDNAAALLPRWAARVRGGGHAGVMRTWGRKKVVLAGCHVQWHRVVLYAGTRWLRMTPHERTSARLFLAGCIARAVRAPPSGLALLHELAYERAAGPTPIPALQRLVAARDASTAERYVGHELGAHGPHLTRGVLFLGAAAGGRPLDRTGAQVAGAILRSKRSVEQCVLSGNALGVQHVLRDALAVGTATPHGGTVQPNPLRNGVEQQQPTQRPRTTAPPEATLTAEAVFDIIESLGSCAVNGRFDFTDFQTAFCNHPCLRRADVAKLFHEIAAGGCEGGRGGGGRNSSMCDADAGADGAVADGPPPLSAHRVISLDEWLPFAAANPHIVQGLYERLTAGLTPVLAGVVHASRREAFCLRSVDLRGCGLSNSELWSCARVALVECDRPVRVLVEGGNGCRGVDAFVQGIIDRCAAGMLSQHAERNAVSVDLDCPCELSRDDLAMFAATLVDYAARRRARGAAAAAVPPPLHLTFTPAVRIAPHAYEEPGVPPCARRVPHVISSFFEARADGVCVGWHGEGLHGAVGSLLAVAARLPPHAPAHVVACTDVDVPLHTLPLFLRINAVLWRHGIPVAHERCVVGPRAAIGAAAARLVAATQQRLLQRAGAGAGVDGDAGMDLQMDDTEPSVMDLDVVAEMLELLQAGVGAELSALNVSFVRCSLSAKHLPSLHRITASGAAGVDLSGNDFTDGDVAALLQEVAAPPPPARAPRSITITGNVQPLYAVDVAVAALHATRPDIAVRTDTGTAGGHASPPAASPRRAMAGDAPADDGLAARRRIMRLLYTPPADAPAADALLAGFAAYRSPKGQLWDPHSVRALRQDCEMAQAQWRGVLPADVVAPIHAFTATLTRRVLWAVGGGATWAVMPAGVAAALDRGMDGSGLRVPKEALQAAGLGEGMTWRAERAHGTGVAVYTMDAPAAGAGSSTHLVRYENPRPGQVSWAPRAHTVLWCATPQRAFAGATHWRRLPPPGVLDYVLSNLPGGMLGGPGWLGDRSVAAAESAAAAGDDAGFSWAAAPITSPALAAAVAACRAQRNPRAPSAAAAAALDDALHGDAARGIECITVVDTTCPALGMHVAPPGRDASHPPGGGVLLVNADHPEVRRFVGRRLHAINGTAITDAASFDAAVAASGASGTAASSELRLAFWPETEAGRLVDSVRAVVLGGTHGAAKLTPTEIETRLQMWTLIYEAVDGVWREMVVGRTADAGAVRACIVCDGGTPDAREGGRTPVPEVFPLHRLSPAEAEQPAEVLNSTLWAHAHGDGDARLEINRHGSSMVMTAAAAAAVPSTEQPVVFTTADGLWRAWWADASRAWHREGGSRQEPAVAVPAAAVVYLRNGWMAGQVRGFAAALRRALAMLDPDAVCGRRASDGPLYGMKAPARYVVSGGAHSGDIPPAGAAPHQSIGVWADFAACSAVPAPRGPTAATTLVFTASAAQGVCARWVAPLAADASRYAVVFDAGCVWAPGVGDVGSSTEVAPAQPLCAVRALQAALREGAAAVEHAAGDEVGGDGKGADRRRLVATLHTLCGAAASLVPAATSKVQIDTLTSLLNTTLCTPALFADATTRAVVEEALRQVVDVFMCDAGVDAAALARIVDPLPDPPPPHNALLTDIIAAAACYARGVYDAKRAYAAPEGVVEGGARTQT